VNSIECTFHEVKGLLDGSITQLRRVVEPHPRYPNVLAPYLRPDGRWTWVIENTGVGGDTVFDCPFGQPGDEVWRGGTLRVLIACEFSGITRDAYASLGHEAWSCDLLDSELPGNHVKGDIADFLEEVPNWDIMIAYPPCTHLAVSGARWFKMKKQQQDEAVKFFMCLVNQKQIPKICVENPISIMSTLYRKPDQIIHPWQFGHGETKATCFWLKGLPLLIPTLIVKGRQHRVHKLPPSPDRWKKRSRTYRGVAKAMAEQWAGKVETK